MKRVAVLALAVLCCSAGYSAVEVGDMAPDFSLPGSDGKQYTLSQMRKHVVIAFFPKAYTSG